MTFHLYYCRGDLVNRPPASPVYVHQQRETGSESSSHPVRNHPLWALNPSPPRLHERGELSTLYNPVICTPAHPNLQPPLSLSVLVPVHVPYPLRSPNRHDGDSTSRYQYRAGEISISDRANVGYGDRPSSFRHLGRGKTRWHLSTEMGEVFKCRCQRVDGMGRDVLDCRGIETCGSRQGNRNICPRPDRQRRFRRRG